MQLGDEKSKASLLICIRESSAKCSHRAYGRLVASVKREAKEEGKSPETKKVWQRVTGQRGAGKSGGRRERGSRRKRGRVRPT